MKKSKDPFEVAFEEQEETPPESPVGLDDNESQMAIGSALTKDGNFDAVGSIYNADASVAATAPVRSQTAGAANKHKEDEEEEDEENVDVEVGKLRPGGDTTKTFKMQEILSQFTEEQMSRYESFRRSGFQKSNMKRLLTTITGSAKVSVPMTIVVSGIAKMLVGDLVETARGVMGERGDRGPIRPCHIREAYRRLRIEGKIPKKSVPRLFR